MNLPIINKTQLSHTSALASLVIEKLTNGRRQPSWGLPVSIPTDVILTRLLDVLFFASIKTEEGRTIQVRVFYMDPSNPDPGAPPRIRLNRWQVFPLGSRLKFSV